jgi:polyhydroxyalkanoate synthesis regulator phasin
MRQILHDTYPEEFFLLQRQMRARKVDEALQELAIASNPHKNPEDAKEFVDDLLSRRRFYRGEADAPEQLDVTAFEKFRKSVTEQSSLVKAK